jgi:hypothetical protein
MVGQMVQDLVPCNFEDSTHLKRRTVLRRSSGGRGKSESESLRVDRYRLVAGRCLNLAEKTIEGPENEDRDHWHWHWQAT